MPQQIDILILKVRYKTHVNQAEVYKFVGIQVYRHSLSINSNTNMIDAHYADL